jgi:hypothetical protein
MRYVNGYPAVQITGQSFEHVKRVTLPNQSMSLQEIVRRFIRKESLPISKDGMYEDRFGDLEKLSRMDIVDQMAKVEELKSQIAAFNVREKARADKAEADRVASLSNSGIQTQSVGTAGVSPKGDGAAAPASP